MRRMLIVTGAVLGLAPHRPLPAQASRLSLADAVRLATRNSPEVRADRARRDEARARRRGAVAALLPVLATSINVQRNPQLGATILPAEVFGGSGGLRVVRLGTRFESRTDRELRVPLFDAAQSAAVRVAAAAIAQAETDVSGTLDSLAFAVQEAYVTLQVKGAEVRAAEAAHAWRVQQASIADADERAGRLVAQERESAQLAAQSAALAIERARLAYTSAEEALGAFLTSDGSPAVLDSVRLVDGLAELAARAQDTTGVGNGTPWSVRDARAEEHVAAAARHQARRASWPTLRLVGAVSTVAFAGGLGDVTLRGDRFTRSSIALQFEPPTLEFGGRRAQRAEADAAWRRAAARREAAERAALLAQRTSRRAREAALRGVQLAETELAVRARALALARASREAGRAGDEAVARAFAEAAEAEAGVARARGEAVRADAQWRQANGSPPASMASATGPVLAEAR